MGRKDTRFGVKHQNLLEERHLLNYEEMFVGTSICIRYVVIIIVIFTSMLAIELFTLKSFVNFLDVYLGTYLFLSFTDLQYFLGKV